MAVSLQYTEDHRGQRADPWWSRRYQAKPAKDANGNGNADPVVTLPLYGRWHALTPRLSKQRDGTPVPDAASVPYAAPIFYDAMTSVPENWIPMIGVHVPGSTREIQLQRGALLRVLDGDPVKPPAKIEPATPSMRTGLDAATPQQYFIAEQEVPRAGTRMTRAFRRTRWRDGRTFVWLSMAKQTGRGEARSRLAFDQIENAPPR